MSPQKVRIAAMELMVLRMQEAAQRPTVASERSSRDTPRERKPQASLFWYWRSQYAGHLLVNNYYKIIKPPKWNKICDFKFELQNQNVQV